MASGRNILKTYFERRDKPTQAQFSEFINSILNLVDDIPLSVQRGGSGLSSFSANSLIASGVTNTSNFQTINSGTAGYVLVSNGSGQLPSFVNPNIIFNFSGITTNYLPKWNGTQFVNSLINEEVSPNPNAIKISGNGIILPGLTTEQINALETGGRFVYNTSTFNLQYHDDNAGLWRTLLYITGGNREIFYNDNNTLGSYSGFHFTGGFVNNIGENTGDEIIGYKAKLGSRIIQLKSSNILPLDDLGLFSTDILNIVSGETKNIIFKNGTTTNGLFNATTGNFELIGQIKIAGGTPGAGKVLTSDVDGLATWGVPASGGITTLNTLTATTQTFATGTSGTDFNISSATSTHTFNIPDSSATKRGLLGTSDWTTFNTKIGGSGTLNYIPKFTSTGTIGNSQIFDDGTNVGIGTTSISYKLHVYNGDIGLTDSTYPALHIKPTSWGASADYQAGLNDACIVAGNYAAIYVPSGKGIVLSRGVSAYNFLIKDSTGYVGINTNNPDARLTINNPGSGTAFAFAIHTGLQSNVFVVMDNGKILAGNSNMANGNLIIGNGTGYAGTNNTVLGVNCFSSITTGSYNITIGNYALYTNSSSSHNIAIGYEALKSVSNLGINIGIGSGALKVNTDARNVAIGFNALYNKISGSNNVSIGHSAGFSSSSGSNNIFIGDSSGYYETGSNKLFIDNVGRNSEADARTKALLYGIFDSTPEVQQLHINSRLYYGVPNSPVSDTDLSNGQVSAYLDEAANTLYFRVKYSDGTTLKTGSISLT